MVMYHLCVPIKTALQKLKKGQNLFNCSSNQVLYELTKAESEGKVYYSGCDNIEIDGSCKGHKVNQNN